MAINVAAAGVVVGAIGLFLLTATDVMMRWVFDSIPGAIDIATYLLAPIAFLGFGYAQLKGSHVRVDVMVTHLPRRLRAVVEVFDMLLIVAAVALLFWFAAKTGLESWEKHAVHYGTLEIPDWIRYFFALLGFSSLILAIVTQLLRRLVKSDGGRPPNWTPPI
ncbi:MAG: TRAP transporter small permease [Chloroflexota bacterium]